MGLHDAKLVLVLLSQLRGHLLRHLLLLKQLLPEPGVLLL